MGRFAFDADVGGFAGLDADETRDLIMFSLQRLDDCSIVEGMYAQVSLHRRGN